VAAVGSDKLDHTATKTFVNTVITLNAKTISAAFTGRAEAASAGDFTATDAAKTQIVSIGICYANNSADLKKRTCVLMYANDAGTDQAKYILGFVVASGATIELAKIVPDTAKSCADGANVGASNSTAGLNAANAITSWKDSTAADAGTGHGTATPGFTKTGTLTTWTPSTTANKYLVAKK